MNLYDLQSEAKERVKEIIIRMNGFTEEEFYNKYNHDVNFNNGFKLFVQMFLKAKFDE